MKTIFRIPVLIAALGLALMFLPSCATQVATSPDGTRLVQIEAFGKASLTRHADGSVEMSSDHEKAVEPVAKVLRTNSYTDAGKFMFGKTPAVINAVKP